MIPDDLNRDDVLAEVDRILHSKSDPKPLSFTTYDPAGNRLLINFAMQEKLLFYGRQALGEMTGHWHLRGIQHGTITDPEIVRMPIDMWIVTLENQNTGHIASKIYMETDE